MTAIECREAIGHARPAWVEKAGQLAILCRVSRDGSESILIRYATARGGYQWVDARSLRRREDCDAMPDPAWLQQARVSRRPDAALWDILNPEYSDRAITERARQAADDVLSPSRDKPANPWLLDEERIPQFETDAEGLVR